MIIDKPLSSIKLSTRLKNICNVNKIITIGELVRMRNRELLALRGFGKTLLREVETIRDEVEDSMTKSKVSFTYESFNETLRKNTSNALLAQWHSDVIPLLDGDESEKVLCCKDARFFIGYYDRYTGWHEDTSCAPSSVDAWMYIPKYPIEAQNTAQ